MIPKFYKAFRILLWGQLLPLLNDSTSFKRIKKRILRCFLNKLAAILWKRDLFKVKCSKEGWSRWRGGLYKRITIVKLYKISITSFCRKQENNILLVFSWLSTQLLSGGWGLPLVWCVTNVGSDFISKCLQNRRGEGGRASHMSSHGIVQIGDWSLMDGSQYYCYYCY